MYNRAQLKVETRRIMAGTRPRPMWIALLYMLIVGVGSSILQNVVALVTGTSYLATQLSNLLLSNGFDPENAVTQMLLTYGDRLASFIVTLVGFLILTSLVSTLWSALMGIGFEGYCLDLVKGERPTVGRLFSGFPLIGKVILTNLLVWVFLVLWSLLACVVMVVFAVVGGLLMDSAAVLGVIILIVGMVLVTIFEIRISLRYAMVDFVLLDTGCYGMEAIRMSKSMMKGNKGKYFILVLSFVGWYLLQGAIMGVASGITAAMAGIAGISYAGGASISMGAVGGTVVVGIVIIAAASIGSLLLNIWLMPYVTGANAKFYLFFKDQTPEVE